MDLHDTKHKNSKGLEQLGKKRITFLTCEDWMTSKLCTVGPDDSVEHARSLLRTHRINQLPVITEGKLVGIITDRDLRGPGLPAAGAPISSKDSGVTGDTLVGALMTHPGISLAPHSTLINAAQVMRQQRVGSLPITDHGRLVGIVTRSDILEALVVFGTGRHTRLDHP